MKTTGVLLQTYLSPAALGLDGVTVASGSPVTSSTFSLKGVSQLSLFVKVTFAAATAIDIALDVTPEGGGEDSAGTSITNWYISQTSAISSGTVTLSDMAVHKATGSASVKYEVRFTDLNTFNGRLRVSSTAGTTDTVVITGIRAEPS